MNRVGLRLNSVCLFLRCIPKVSQDIESSWQSMAIAQVAQVTQMI
ncbi:MAG: hypothetical protein ACFE0J_02980 [Elainellaceae cyanobacterium]